MAAPFPTALQRTSDERWVTLEVVAREQDRAVARILEAPRQSAVVRAGGQRDYDRHLRQLLETPPPQTGAGVHLAWPADLLHDLDAQVVGYAADRPKSRRTVSLAEFADPRHRAEVAPMATRRHLLRVARNVSTATAALHHAGHARVRGRQFRLDDAARVVVVRLDELLADATATQIADDRRRLGYLVLRLLGTRPWATDGELADLIARAADPAAPPAPAEEWFFALREAERALPDVRPAAPADAAPTIRAAAGTTLTPAAPAAVEPAPSAPAAPAAVEPALPTTRTPRPAPAHHRSPAEAPVAPARGGWSNRRRGGATSTTSDVGRATFAAATGLAVGGLASVAPFAVFALVAALVVLRAAIRVGRRKATLGPHQTAAITLTRLVPFSVGGLALGAFLLLDLLLVLGLCMAIAERVFGYGPGFTLGWILQLPEVPGLVRGFAFAVGAFGGLVLGGPTHDRLQEGRRSRVGLAAPAVALALATAALTVDAGVVWWPLPLAA